MLPQESRTDNINVRRRGRVIVRCEGGEILKKFMKFLTASVAAAGLLFAAVLGTADYFTPDSYTVTAGSRLRWLSGALSVVRDGEADVSASTAAQYPQSYDAQLMLYDTIPLKAVKINVVDQTCVVLSGKPFGIEMFTNGVVVVGLADIKTDTGSINPAIDAGLKVGDVITAIDGKTVSKNTDVQQAVESCRGKTLKFTVRRDGAVCSLSVRPVCSEADGLYKAGVWVRDSTAGIGTLTYYDPSTSCFAGLGHGICDSDTGKLMPLLSGNIVSVTINGITQGRKGAPGELRGYFSDDAAIGTLLANVPSGVYGRLARSPQGPALKAAMKQEVKPGPVKILTTIHGSSPQYFNAEIERIDYRDSAQSKNMVLRITDEKLLSQTGGIVQGMSGSPIVQNGKLVGAVTHVFVNDPTCGYGIFAENMLEESRAAGALLKQKVS
ncbi:MAG TPA: SpoIVB peptidase [Ruminococcaceae bacterium]|nr:SpoIVB peptidase [Oscillospiraceae bacterium]